MVFGAFIKTRKEKEKIRERMTTNEANGGGRTGGGVVSANEKCL